VDEVASHPIASARQDFDWLKLAIKKLLLELNFRWRGRRWLCLQFVFRSLSFG